MNKTPIFLFFAFLLALASPTFFGLPFLFVLVIALKNGLQSFNGKRSGFGGQVSKLR